MSNSATNSTQEIRREEPLEYLVHVGYAVTLTPEVMRQIQLLFPKGLVPEQLNAGPHITAVLHVSENTKQDEMHRWFRKASKNTEDVARVRSIFYQRQITRDKKTNEPKSCRAIIALYITVGGNHLYLNVYNDIGMRPFTVKKAISSGAFKEKKLETPLTVSATAYK